MKKLNKLQIKSERLMKSEDLITLKGGYGPTGGHCCWCLWGNDQTGAMAAGSDAECWSSCSQLSNGIASWQC